MEGEGAGEVARAAMAAVQEGRREDWLGLFADDAVVEDPVGQVPPITDRASLAQFWDLGIATLDSVRFEVTREWEAGEEALLLATVTVTVATGASATYDGAFGYALDDERRISALRAFWDLPAVVEALTSQA
jgi:steroid Delta-isomerase